MTSFRFVRTAVAVTRSASATVSAIGFSRNTCAPASIALIAYSAWVSGIVLIDTTSGLTAPRASSNDVNRAASASASGTARVRIPRVHRPATSNPSMRE